MIVGSNRTELSEMVSSSFPCLLAKNVQSAQQAVVDVTLEKRKNYFTEEAKNYIVSLPICCIYINKKNKTQYLLSSLLEPFNWI